MAVCDKATCRNAQRTLTLFKPLAVCFYEYCNPGVSLGNLHKPDTHSIPHLSRKVGIPPFPFGMRAGTWAQVLVRVLPLLVDTSGSVPPNCLGPYSNKAIALTFIPSASLEATSQVVVKSSPLLILTDHLPQRCLII